jgi:hypothetical protein
MTFDLTTVLTIAFVIAVTAFVKKQFALTGWKVLLAAFIIVLVVALIPLIAASYPPVAPWVNTIGIVIVLFLSATGTTDFVTDIRTKEAPPTPGL